MFKILADAWKNAPADVKADYEAKRYVDPAINLDFFFFCVGLV